MTCVFLFCLVVVSSVVSSDGEPWSASSSSDSDEDLQPPPTMTEAPPIMTEAPPTPPEAPPGVIVEVEDMKTNVSLSFAIFIVTKGEEGEEEEEGEGGNVAVRRGRSDDISKRDDISHDVISEGSTRPMALILSAELETSSQPMTEENTDHMITTGDQHLSSGEMMTDEETDDFNNTSSSVDSWSQKQTLSDDFDYFNNTSAETDVHQTLTVFDESDDFNNNTKIMEIYSQQTITVDYSDDNNNTGSDDFSNKTTAPTSPLSDESDDFNNSTVINDQPVRIVFDSSHDTFIRSDEPPLSLSDDFNNSEVPQLNPDLQGITLNPDNLSTRNNQQGALGVETVDELVLDPVSQEVMSSNSEKMSSGIQDRTSSNRGSISEGFRSGSRLQEVFHSIHKVVDLLSGNQRVTGLKGSHHKVLGSTPFTGSQTGFLLNSDQSSEFVSTDPKKSTISSTLQGTGSRDSTQQVSGPTTSWSRRSSRSLARVDSSSSSDSSEEGQDSGGATLGLGSDSRDSSPEVSSSSEEALLGLKSSSSPPLVTSPVPSPQTPTKSGSLWSDSNESDLSGSGSESDSPEVDSRNNSQSPDLNPNQVLISDSNLGPESTLNPNRSEISQGSATIRVPTDANSETSKEANSIVDYNTNTASIAASPEVSMDAKPDGGVKDTEAGAEATTDSSSNVSVEAYPTTATVYGADVSINLDKELSAEEEDDASKEATTGSVVSIKPTAAAEYSTNPAESGASTDAIANVEKEEGGADVSTEASPDAENLGPNQTAGTEENDASPLPPPPPLPPPSPPPPSPPPRRKQPYHFGFLNPISRFYSSQPRILATQQHQFEKPQHRHYRNVYLSPVRRHQMVSRHTNRKQMKVSVAAVAYQAQSSSEEINQ